jgi:hypothetical protein
MSRNKLVGKKRINSVESKRNRSIDSIVEVEAEKENSVEKNVNANARRKDKSRSTRMTGTGTETETTIEKGSERWIVIEVATETDNEIVSASVIERDTKFLRIRREIDTSVKERQTWTLKLVGRIRKTRKRRRRNRGTEVTERIKRRRKRRKKGRNTWQ